MLEHNNQNEEMQHIESEEEVEKKEDMQRSPKPKKTWKGRGFLNTVGAGIIGSVLTLTVLPQTDYYQNLAQTSIEQSTHQGETDTAADSGITPTTVSTAGSGDVASIVEDASESIVGIVNYQQQNGMGGSQEAAAGTGSGVLFKKEGDSAYIITNNHVIEGASKIEVSLYDGEKTEGELIGADPLTDLAVVKIDGKYADNLLEVGDSSALRAGEQVIAIGNPLGLDLSRTVTQGIVSAVDRTIPVQTSEGESELNVIQTDAAINPGNSGGALLNAKGELIGINSAKISNSGVEGLGFAIPSKDFMPIVSEIIETGKVERPYIGIGMKNLSEIPRSYLPNLPESVESGVVIANIDPTSAAADAGIKEGDAITEMNGKKVENVADLRRQLYGDLKVGDKIDLTIYRDGKKMTVSLTLTSNSMMNG
ncbi:S1C family serine protease [Rossellomorea aquimaris]|uniref:S1C family serine protease n=1 Tax=Rossellomorea aquimaris TaxID=189382 RepID=UPI001CFEF7F1|nr:trypsin-like peptidase domain-containing protein [Rossellomorea aquimaris]